MLKKMMMGTSLAASLMIVGCTTMSNPATDRNLALLQNKDWILTQVNQTNYKVDASQSNAPSLKFDNSQVSGSDGCNRIFGGYTVKGTQIQFVKLATTAMACLSASDLPTQFNQALSQVTHYKATDTTLELLDKDNQVQLEFSRAQN